MDPFKKLEGLKTLLIEDNQIVRDTFTMVFAHKNCALKAVMNAEDGLRALEKERFDIIISDFRLPGINGVEFLKKAVDIQPHTVRVLITGYGNEEMINEVYRSGAHEFMQKPFSLNALLERLLPHIDKYNAAELTPKLRQNKCGI